MSYRFELRTDRPILVNTLGPSIGPDLISAMAAEALSLLNRVDRPVFYLIDADGVYLSTSDIMDGAYADVLGINPPLRHHNIIEKLVVTADPILAMAARSVSSPLFGDLHINALPSLAEALAYVDSRLAAARM